MTWIDKETSNLLRKNLAAHINGKRRTKTLNGKNHDLYEITLDEYYAMCFLMPDLFDSLGPATAILGGSMLLGYYDGRPVFFNSE